MAEISVSVDVEAPPEQVFAAAVDWDGQHEWMFLTRVRGTAQDGRGVGGQLVAVTGVGRLSFADPMTVTVWDPPHRCVVRHDGRVVRGSAAFEVQPLPDGRSRFVWTEWLDLPLGLLGQLGFVLVRPLVLWPLRRSMRRFATWAARHPGRG